MRVRIVCCEDVNSWILGKMSRRLGEHLQQLGVNADVSRQPDPSADINHHIIYLGYNGKQHGIDTVMVTHVDTEDKVRLLRKQLSTVEMAICMSADTMTRLIRRGLPRSKLCYVHPAHDNELHPRKLVIGITSRVYSDERKRETILTQLATRISPADFKFWIMGSGWDSIIAEMRTQGVEVDYCDHFDLEQYRKLMPHLDYYLYFGLDEGSMGFLDALNAGIPTIVTPQGFHLDAQGGLVYPFNELPELVGIFADIAERRRRLTSAVASWTWPEYARKHLLIWQYLLSQKTGAPLALQSQREFLSMGVAKRWCLAASQTAYYRTVERIHLRIRRLLG